MKQQLATEGCERRDGCRCERCRMDEALMQKSRVAQAEPATSMSSAERRPDLGCSQVRRLSTLRSQSAGNALVATSPTDLLTKAKSAQAVVHRVAPPANKPAVAPAQGTAMEGAARDALDDQMAVARSMLRFVKRTPNCILPPAKIASQPCHEPPRPAAAPMSVLHRSDNVVEAVYSPHQPLKPRLVERPSPFQARMVKLRDDKSSAPVRPTKSLHIQMAQTDRVLRELVDDPCRELAQAAQAQVATSFTVMAHELQKLGQRVQYLEQRGGADPANHSKLPALGRRRDPAASSVLGQKLWDPTLRHSNGGRRA